MSKTDDMELMFAEPISDWYRYFAWYPISTHDRGWRWLCPVWKRKCQMHEYLPGPIDTFYQYRASAPVEDSVTNEASPPEPQDL